jgi:hypothetical protein
LVVLTDMFGGTPSNLAISVMNGSDIEVSSEHRPICGFMTSGTEFTVGTRATIWPPFASLLAVAEIPAVGGRLRADFRGKPPRAVSPDQLAARAPRGFGAGTDRHRASEAHRGRRLDLSDLARPRGWGALGAYGRSKLCNILFTRELAARLDGSAVVASCLHPGVVATRLASAAV